MMNTDNQNQYKPATDKIHAPDLGETQNFNELTFNKEKNTFEVDVKGEDKDYDHPFQYETPSENGADFNSTYDEANPYIGDEYASNEEKANDQLEELGMHIDSTGESVLLSAEDELLARTEEDFRDDLDEEGYPKNDAPNS